jgi:hypothetical protein
MLNRPRGGRAPDVEILSRLVEEEEAVQAQPKQASAASSDARRRCGLSAVVLMAAVLAGAAALVVTGVWRQGEMGRVAEVGDIKWHTSKAITVSIAQINDRVKLVEKDFDCHLMKHMWKTAWKDDKKEWCCANEKIGCVNSASDNTHSSANKTESSEKKAKSSDSKKASTIAAAPESDAADSDAGSTTAVPGTTADSGGGKALGLICMETDTAFLPYDYIDGKFIEFTNQDSREDCWKYCQTVEGCIAFSFHETSSACHLGDGKSIKTPDTPGFVSGHAGICAEDGDGNALHMLISETKKQIKTLKGYIQELVDAGKWGEVDVPSHQVVTLEALLTSCEEMSDIHDDMKKGLDVGDYDKVNSLLSKVVTLHCFSNNKYQIATVEGEMDKAQEAKQYDKVGKLVEELEKLQDACNEQKDASR